MKTVKLHKIMECEVPVWENDVMTDVKEPRTLVVFVRETTALGGLKTVAQFGSLLLDRGVTVEQATTALTKDNYADEVEFVEVPDSKFYKVRLL
jgi:hypothetical protein